MKDMLIAFFQWQLLNIKIMSMTRHSYVNITNYLTFFNSTSNTKVEFGGITGGEPLAPYL